jgi:hypothetical protein
VRIGFEVSEAAIKLCRLFRREVRVVPVFRYDLPKVLRKFEPFFLRKGFGCCENFGRTHVAKLLGGAFPIFEPLWQFRANLLPQNTAFGVAAQSVGTTFRLFDLPRRQTVIKISELFQNLARHFTPFIFRQAADLFQNLCRTHIFNLLPRP